VQLAAQLGRRRAYRRGLSPSWASKRNVLGVVAALGGPAMDPFPSRSYVLAIGAHVGLPGEADAGIVCQPQFQP
jgi:hypothetical protein